MSIRSTAKAIILNNGKILLNKCYDENNGDYYSLPGGGQNQYETLEFTVARECLEETGYTVKVIGFAGLCEEICDDIVVREQRPDYAHKLNFVFFCELLNETKVAPTEIDNMQICSEWVDINSLSTIRILPKAVGDNIQGLINSKIPAFLGSQHIPFNHG